MAGVCVCVLGPHRFIAIGLWMMRFLQVRVAFLLVVTSPSLALSVSRNNSKIFLILLFFVFSFRFGCFSSFSSFQCKSCCGCRYFWCSFSRCDRTFLFVEMIELTKWLSKWNVIWAHFSSEKCYTLNARVRTWAKPIRYSIEIQWMCMVFCLLFYWCVHVWAVTQACRDTHCYVLARVCAPYQSRYTFIAVSANNRDESKAVMILCDMCKSHVVYICNFCQFCVLSLACMCCVGFTSVWTTAHSICGVERDWHYVWDSIN